MKMTHFLLLLWITIFIFAACSSKTDPATAPADDAAQAESVESGEQPAIQDNVFSAQINAVKKAKQVDRLVQEHDKEMRKQLDESLK